MMDDLKSMFDSVVNGMQTPLHIYGFSFSFWDIFLWSIIAVIVAYVVGRIING